MLAVLLRIKIIVGTLDNTSLYTYRHGDSEFVVSGNWSDGTYYNYGGGIVYEYVQRVSKLSRFLKLDTPLSQLRTNIQESKIINPKPFNISAYNVNGKSYKHVVYCKEDGGVRASHGTCAIASVEDEIYLTGDNNLISYLFVNKENYLFYFGKGA